MSNKASNSLFELIKSLNKSEKRYFKVFSSRHTIGEENGYITLFDYIDKMESYDEDVLFRDFKGQPLLNKFSITKGRLYSNILKSLDSFHSSSSIDAQLFRQMHSAEILFNKGLYGQAEKVLSSAEKQAIKHERFNLQMEIRHRQKMLLENMLYTDITAEKVEELLQEDKTLMREIERYNELWHLKSLLFREINHKGKSRDEKSVLRLQEIVARMDDNAIKNCSVNTQYLYHHAKSAYYFAVNDLNCSQHHLKTNCDLLESNETLLNDKPNIYFSLLTNLIYISTRLKNYADAQAGLAKLKNLSKSGEGQKTLDLEIKYFSSTFSLELFLLCEQGNFKKAESLVPRIEEGYRKYGEQINGLRRAYIDFKVAVTFLSLGEFSKALQWINRILNESKIDQKQDIYCFAQLINLIIHFELNNSRFLPYAITSVKRYFKTRDRIYRFEEIFLKLINQLTKTENVFDLEDKLIPFEQELIQLQRDPQEQVVFEYFDFLAWVQSKVRRKPFLEMRSAAMRTAV
jgi:hypothetical protein